MHHHEQSVGIQLLIYVFFFFMIGSYIVAVFRTNKRFKKWPVIRIVFWVLGVLVVLFAITGPIAERAHTSFVEHMLAHLLIGMLGPLLLVLATPMKLLLRAVPVSAGRFISRVLKSVYVQWVTHPLVACFLNVGGLWILYTTDLYSAMHSSMWVFFLVHVHLFMAGYVFTLSMIYVDVTPHRTSFQLRAFVLILAMAAHGILSKWIYVNPPAGIGIEDAQQGGMLMYYGGDAIDLIIVIILCTQYFSGRSMRREKAAILS